MPTFLVESSFRTVPNVEVIFAFTSSRRAITSLTNTARNHGADGTGCILGMFLAGAANLNMPVFACM